MIIGRELHQSLVGQKLIYTDDKSLIHYTIIACWLESSDVDGIRPILVFVAMDPGGGIHKGDLHKDFRWQMQR